MARKFLAKGDKVKVTLRLEDVKWHIQLLKILDIFIKRRYCRGEKPARLERNMTMFLSENVKV